MLIRQLRTVGSSLNRRSFLTAGSRIALAVPLLQLAAFLAPEPIPLSLLGRSELINETPERLKPGMMENVMSFFGR